MMNQKQSQTRFEEQKRRLPEMSTRQLVAGLIGAVLYGLLYWITSRFPIPAFGILFRPGVAIPVFIGLSYGPWAGLLAGFIGNALGDVFSSGFFYWNWSLGNALIGLISGLMRIRFADFATGIGILKAIGWSALSIAAGMMFASLAEIFVSGIDLRTAVVDYFPIAFLAHFAGVIVLLPIFMIVFAAVVSRQVR